jgi:hypothetical protein
MASILLWRQQLMGSARQNLCYEIFMQNVRNFIKSHIFYNTNIQRKARQGSIILCLFLLWKSAIAFVPFMLHALQNHCRRLVRRVVYRFPTFIWYCGQEHLPQAGLLFAFSYLSNHPTHLLSVYDATDYLHQDYTECSLLDYSIQITCHIERTPLHLHLCAKGQRVMQSTYGIRRKSFSGGIHANYCMALQATEKILTHLRGNILLSRICVAQW